MWFGQKHVHVKLRSAFGRAIIMNPPRGQMCSAFGSIAKREAPDAAVPLSQLFHVPNSCLYAWSLAFCDIQHVGQLIANLARRFPREFDRHQQPVLFEADYCGRATIE
jgi:hypothetical protein